MEGKTVYRAVLCILGFISYIESKPVKHHAEVFQHQEELFSKLTGNSSQYKMRLRPPSVISGMPIEIKTSLYVYGMSSLDEIRTDYQMQLLYRQTWLDPRLKFPPNVKVDYIAGNKWHADHIWKPSVYAVNDKDFFSTDSFGDNILIRIYPEGRVLLSKRVKLRPFCKMHFHRYPMDKQQCTLEIETILPSSEMVLRWADETPLDLNENFLINGFSLTNYTLEHTTVSYTETGNFSRITVRFDIQREFGHFVLDIYIPSALFVVTSWLSFWVEVPAAPARVTLGMTTMLTLVTSEKAIRDKLPKISYVHALDIWNVVCTGFVFASLVEYALVNYIYHKDKRRRRCKHMKRAESTMSVCSMESEITTTNRLYVKKNELEPGMPIKKVASLSDLQSVSPTQSEAPSGTFAGWIYDEFKMTPQDVANSIDRKCRFIFPGGFFVFNVIYWLVLWL